MSESKQIACDSCEYRGIASLAVKYCRSCQEHLCKECIDFHRSFKLTRGHLLVDTEDKKSIQLCLGIDNLRVCQNHSNKQVEFYCFAHEELLCSLCLIKSEHHRECKNTVVDIESVGKSLMECHFSATAKFEFEKSISNAKDAIQTMKAIKDESTVHTKNLKSNIEQLRAKLITTFDRQTKGIIQKAAEISTDIYRRYSTTIESLEDTVKSAENDKLLLESVLESGLPEDIFRCSIRILELIANLKIETENVVGEEDLRQEIVIEKSNLLKKLEKSEKPLVQFKVKETKIERPIIDLNKKSHEEMRKRFLSLCSIEDKKHREPVEAIEHKDICSNTKTVEIETETLTTVSNSSDDIDTDKYVNTGKGKEKTFISKTNNEDNKVELEHNCCFSVSAPDNKVSWFGGLTCLPSEKLVISDFKYSRLFLLNKDYQIESTKNLEYEPGHVNLLSENCISVCLMKTSQILLVNVQQGNLKENKYVQTKFHPKCVQPVDNKLLVSCQNANGEWKLNLITALGEVCREIKLARFFDGYRIAVQRLKRGERGLRIIQCCEVTSKLQCFEFDGTFVFDKEISKVTSVLTDSNGYIYVIRYTGEIQVLDPDGELEWKMFRQPLNKAKFAAFNKTMDKLFITLYKSPKLNVLNVKRTTITNV